MEKGRMGSDLGGRIRMSHPHKPYIKAYLLYGIIAGALFFVLGIPIVGIARFVCRCLGRQPEVLNPIMPYVRLVISAVIGYFVFRIVIRRQILPYFHGKSIERDQCPGPSQSADEQR